MKYCSILHGHVCVMTAYFHRRNPDMAIVKADDTNRVAFFHYNQGPRDNMTSFGQQFLFSTGYKQTSTPAFPAAGIYLCFATNGTVSRAFLVQPMALGACLCIGGKKNNTISGLPFHRLYMYQFHQIECYQYYQPLAANVTDILERGHRKVT